MNLVTFEEKIIPEGALDEPIQLDEEIIKALPPAVSEQLSKTKLRDVMLHRGRYGDYLDNYKHAIEKALKEESSIPSVRAPGRMDKQPWTGMDKQPWT